VPLSLEHTLGSVSLSDRGPGRKPGASSYTGKRLYLSHTAPSYLAARGGVGAGGVGGEQALLERHRRAARHVLRAVHYGRRTESDKWLINQISVECLFSMTLLSGARAAPEGARPAHQPLGHRLAA